MDGVAQSNFRALCERHTSEGTTQDLFLKGHILLSLGEQCRFLGNGRFRMSHEAGYLHVFWATRRQGGRSETLAFAG